MNREQAIKEVAKPNPANIGRWFRFKGEDTNSQKIQISGTWNDCWYFYLNKHNIPVYVHPEHIIFAE